MYTILKDRRELRPAADPAKFRKRSGTAPDIDIPRVSIISNHSAGGGTLWAA
jgi:hypothetical protein